ncbi:MAG: tetratricopeptide repeat-containing sensor histidine kinase [Candidatus Cloacimonetes bacterium]|nr:tetratricopeptide repeat-containing sensor histidine kinase [Candidatus Cloacimonadota bacterium]
MKNTLLILLFLTILLYLYPGDSEIDILKSRLKRIKENTVENKIEKAKILIKLSEFHHYIDPDKSIEYGKQALKLSRETGDLKKQALALDNIGYGYFFTGNFTTAKKYFNNSMEIDKKIDDKTGLSYSLNGLNLVHRELGEIDKAFEYCNRSLEAASEVDYKMGVYIAYNSLAGLYRSICQYDKAIEYYQLSLETGKDFMKKSHFAGTLMNIAHTYTIIGDNNKALEYAYQSLEIMKETEDSLGVAMIYGTIGLAYQDIGENEKALKYLLQALSLVRKTGSNKQMAGIIFNIGNSYLRLGLTDKAFENYLQSKEIFEETGSKVGIALTYSTIGQLYQTLNKNNEALEYYERSLDLYKELNNKEKISDILGNLAGLSSGLGDYDKALEYHQRALVLRKEIGSGGIAWSLLDIGDTYYFMNEIEKTLDYSLQAKSIFEEINNKRGLARALHNIADCYFQLNNFEDAVGNLYKSIEISNEIKNRELILKSYDILSDHYSSQDDHKNALKYYKLYTSIKDTLFTEQKSKNLVDLQLKYDTEKKDKENEILKKENALQRIIKLRLYYSLALIFLLVFFIYYRFRSKQKLNRILEIRIKEALKKQKEQQQIIIHQASLTSLGELAAGIAHEINQPLQSLFLSTESIDLESKEEKSDKVYIQNTIKEIYDDVERIRKIIEHIRIFSSGQRDEINEEFSINDSINAAFSMMKQQFDQHQINVNFKFDKELSTVLGNTYKFEQVVVNLLNNARDALEGKLKISKEDFTKKINITTYQNEQNIIMEIMDNGIGIPMKNQTNIFLPFYTTKELGKGTGLGLSISYGIIREMNGIVEISSKHLEGAKFTVKIPRT